MPELYEEVIAFELRGEPIPKGRPRSTPQGRLITPKRTRDAERMVRLRFEALYPSFRPLEGPLFVEAIFYRQTNRHADTDNLFKLVTDALNRVAYLDDEQIEKATQERIYGAGDQARTVVRISRRINELPELFGDTEKE